MRHASLVGSGVLALGADKPVFPGTYQAHKTAMQAHFECSRRFIKRVYALAFAAAGTSKLLGNDSLVAPKLESFVDRYKVFSGNQR